MDPDVNPTKEGANRTAPSWRENFSGAQVFLVLICALFLCAVLTAVIIAAE